MRVLVVGSGSREHAITWKLAQSPSNPTLFVAPGNAGTAQIAKNVPIGAEDIDSLIEYAKSNGIDLTVVGPEMPLASGIVDRFNEAGLLVFGPTQRAARIESSKIFAKQIMASAGVPTAASQHFDTSADAINYIESAEPPYVIKADGLAAGKGVIMAPEPADAISAIQDMMDNKAFGSSGGTALVEEWMTGQEVSVFAFVDGEYVSPMVAACDYKRIGDEDTGPNTGGMGSYSPPPFWNDDLDEQVRRIIVEPVVKEMARIGSSYLGVLYAGLMLTESGPKVIEFNCRLGDPETQVILPRLQSDLLEIFHRAALGELKQTDVVWNDLACVGVVSASAGYPESYETGFEISGLDTIDPSSMVFHAGTKPTASSNPVTSGGRVLTVTGTGSTLAEATAVAYDNTSRIVFEGRYHRTDIAANLGDTTMALVAVLMGSSSDKDAMQETSDVLGQMGIEHVVEVMSAHRTPEKVKDYAESARDRGIELIIAGAGGSAGLPGVVASWTTLPVIGVPLPTSDLKGVDALYAIAQMPPGIPVACVAVGSWGARNAAFLAAQILGIKHPEIQKNYDQYRDGLKSR